MEVVQYRGIDGAGLSADMENRAVSGYGIVFDSDSHPMQIWDDSTGRIIEVVEQISRDSLQDTDMRDVISAYNHNFEKVLGRTASGTMKISRDAKGIKYRVDVPNTSYANDVLDLLQRGDLSGSSFVFTMDWQEGYDITERDNGQLVAIPKKIKRVFEMGPVITPAYPETTAENRSAGLEKAVKRFLAEKEKAETREEKPIVEDLDQPTVEEKEAIENRNITYPNIMHYQYKVKVNSYKKRV